MEEHRRNRQNRYGRILCGLVFLALCGTIFCMGVNAREARREARKAEAVKEAEAEKKKAEKEEKNNMETIKITRYQSPVGEMLVGSYGDKLCICDWAVEKRRGTIDRRIQRHLNAKYEEGTSDIIERAIGELEEYFAGHRKIFDIPVVFTGSEFQCTVWEELMKIPYGTTISYGELARRIHNPKAVRAVASANATNPISIFVPCHRVIGSNHKLTGYGGGLDAKKGLLELECSKTMGLGLW